MRRILSVTGSALAVLALGFMVSVAATSVPGRDADEPFLDLAWRPGVDVTSILTWLVLIAAVLGVIIMALAAREAPPPREHKRRGIMVLILGILVFALVARYMRTIADSLLPEASEVIGEVDEQPISEGSGNGAWVLSLLVAAVIALALTRVGLAVRSGAPPFQDRANGEAQAPVSVASVASPRTRGTDPRGRIFGAYGDFEQSVAGAGVPRGPSETAAQHAGRARLALRLSGPDLSLLSARHADARFGPDEPSVQAAAEAESASARLRKDVPH